DGTARLWDEKTSKSVRCFAAFEGEAVASVAFGSQPSEMVFAAAGNKVFSFDLRKPDIIYKTFETEYAHNQDEVNSLAISPNGRFLATCDDSGDVKIIDLQSNTLFKSLRKHSNICSTVCFRGERRPWEVLSGGLDSLLVHWDFSRGRPIHHHDLVGLAMNSPQVVNPPFVHSIDVSADANVALAALGDNSVLIYDLDRDLPVVQLEDGHSTSVSQANVGQVLTELREARSKKGKAARQQNNRNKKKTTKGSTEEEEASKPKPYRLEQRINHGSKINWLCTAPLDASALGNLFVADQTSAITAYHILP
ncbi:WD domain, G-beta repeat-containing protein, partial [Acanthamoeba castellanii str. Neff]